MKLYENIKERRTSLGITQAQLAELTGYSDKSAIAKIEKGIVDIPQSKILLFAQALHTTASDLMGWEEMPPGEPELTEGEQLLIELFRKVPEERQPMVLEMIRAALKNL